MGANGWMPQHKMFQHGVSLYDKFADFQNCGIRNSMNCTKVQWLRSDDSGKNVNKAEMMLNTDICLVYTNGFLEPVKASRDECCTWFSSGIPRPAKNKIFKNNGDMWCGLPGMPGKGGVMHRRCCGGNVATNCGICKDNIKKNKFI